MYIWISKNDSSILYLHMTEKKSSREKQHGGRGTTASLFKEKKMKYVKKNISLKLS